MQNIIPKPKTEKQRDVAREKAKKLLLAGKTLLGADKIALYKYKVEKGQLYEWFKWKNKCDADWEFGDQYTLDAQARQAGRRITYLLKHGKIKIKK